GRTGRNTFYIAAREHQLLKVTRAQHISDQLFITISRNKPDPVLIRARQYICPDFFYRRMLIPDTACELVTQKLTAACTHMKPIPYPFIFMKCKPGSMTRNVG